MSIAIHGARCAFGPEKAIQATIEVTAARITQISPSFTPLKSGCERIDLSGYLLMPGLINAHDHLQFALFPRLANPPYGNYIEWGEDIHNIFRKLIAFHKTIPRHVRLWWGGIRNLLCGVTTVCHHDSLWPELRQSDFPVRVLQRYGWAHSLAFGGNLHAAHAATSAKCPFIMHACEGVDDTARRELWQLDRLGLLDASTVLVHALALGPEGTTLLRNRNTSVILCPSSNQFLFGRTPDLSLFIGINLALGNDSPLTALGDLLDEVHFATHACNFPAQAAYRMVTDLPASILRLNSGEGSITEFGAADLIAVRDTGDSPANTLHTLSAADVEFVMIRGRVQLASDALLERLPASIKEGLEPLSINRNIRWLRAPVNTLLKQAENMLGRGNLRLAGKYVCDSEKAVASYGC